MPRTNQEPIAESGCTKNTPSYRLDRMTIGIQFEPFGQNLVQFMLPEHRGQCCVRQHLGGRLKRPPG
jgi:hypothetical protein